MALTPKDKKVIRDFIKKKESKSKKLESTGQQLDGSWMGGTNIANHNNGLNVRVSSKMEESIVNYIKKIGVNYRYR